MQELVLQDQADRRTHADATAATDARGCPGATAASGRSGDTNAGGALTHTFEGPGPRGSGASSGSFGRSPGGRAPPGHHGAWEGPHGAAPAVGGGGGCNGGVVHQLPLAAGDGYDGGGFERLSDWGSDGCSDHVSSGGGAWGFAFGGAQRRALEGAIRRLADATRPAGGVHAGGGVPGFGAGVASPAHAQAAERAAALAVLAAPEVHPQDLLSCDTWPDLCRALPPCLIAPLDGIGVDQGGCSGSGAECSRGSGDDSGGGGTGCRLAGGQPAGSVGAGPAHMAAVSAVEATADAAPLLLQRLSHVLLEGAPLALAALLAPLLEQLVAFGVGGCELKLGVRLPDPWAERKEEGGEGAPRAADFPQGEQQRQLEERQEQQQRPQPLSSQPAPALAVPLPDQALAQRTCSVAVEPPLAPEAPASAAAAAVFVLRALHALGQQWHYLPDDVAPQLCRQVILLVLQATGREGGSNSDGNGGGSSSSDGGGGSDGSGGRGGSDSNGGSSNTSYSNSGDGSSGGARGGPGGGAASGQGRMPALQVLLTIDPGMLWWHRLFALAAFKRMLLPAAPTKSGISQLIESVTQADGASAGGGAPAQERGSDAGGPPGEVGTADLGGALMAALAPVWMGRRALPQGWRRRAAVHLTRSLLTGPWGAFASEARRGRRPAGGSGGGGAADASAGGTACNWGDSELREAARRFVAGALSGESPVVV